MTDTKFQPGLEKKKDLWLFVVLFFPLLLSMCHTRSYLYSQWSQFFMVWYFFEKYSINCLFRPKYDNSSKKISNSKGQIISKSLFGVFNFIQKTNKNTLHTFKNEFIFGKNSQLDKINRPLKRILFRMSFLFIIVSYNLNRKFYMTKIHQNLILINGSTIGPLKMVNKYIWSLTLRVSLEIWI